MKSIYLFYVDFHLYQNIRQNDELLHLDDHTHGPTLAYPYVCLQSAADHQAAGQRYVYLAIMYSIYGGVAEYPVNIDLAVDVAPG